MNPQREIKGSAKPRSTSAPLQCHVSVEPSSIDFLNAGAVLVAGSSSDCSLISPVPVEPGQGRRRRPATRAR